MSVEIWNIDPDGVCVAGAQTTFNVVGRVDRYADLRHLKYSLNHGPETAVVVGGAATGSKRLARPGDFNIDTIALRDLRDSNYLRLALYGGGGRVSHIERTFRVRFVEAGEPRWQMDLHRAHSAQEIGQIVDGRWHVGDEPDGRRYIGVAAEDAGYDRVLLVGHRDWTSGYEIRARFRVDQWTRSISQGIGCAFRWNAHRRGDGTELPEEWSTAVAWSFSESPGLTLRVGVGAQKGADGRWVGETILAEGSLSPWRARLSRLSRRIDPSSYVLPQIVAGTEYGYRLTVDEGRLALTMWDLLQPQPPPQVVARAADVQLPRGSVGLIAHHCAVRVYELSVLPLA